MLKPKARKRWHSSFRLRSGALSEAVIQEQCRRALLSHPKVAGVLRLNGGATRSPGGSWVRFYSFWRRGDRTPLSKGVHDFLVFLNDSRVVLVEFKSGVGSLSDEQAAIHEWAAIHKIQSSVVDSLDSIGQLIESLS